MPVPTRQGDPAEKHSIRGATDSLDVLTSERKSGRERDAGNDRREPIIHLVAVLRCTACVWVCNRLFVLETGVKRWSV